MSGHTLLEFQLSNSQYGHAEITSLLVVLLLFYIIFVVLIKIFAHLVNNGNKRAIMDKSRGPF